MIIKEGMERGEEGAEERRGSCMRIYRSFQTSAPATKQRTSLSVNTTVRQRTMHRTVEVRANSSRDDEFRSTQLVATGFPTAQNLFLGSAIRRWVYRQPVRDVIELRRRLISVVG